LLREVLFFSPPAAARLLLLALLAMDFSLWRWAACALLAFFVPVLAAPRLPLLRLASSDDLPVVRALDRVFMGKLLWG
jgi:hypothetical protein